MPKMYDKLINSCVTLRTPRQGTEGITSAQTEESSSISKKVKILVSLINAAKCHFLLSGPKNVAEHTYVKVGDQIIWESLKEILLGLTIDKKLKFQDHVHSMIKKASSKLAALTRLARFLCFDKKKILMNSFIEQQFTNTPVSTGPLR